MTTPAPVTAPAPITLRPGGARGVTNLGWLHSKHSFSFGRYHDPANLGYRALRVLNDDIVAPGGGFGEHGHDNMEILTWVLDGVLRHGDSLGHLQRLTPGELQVMTAGAGIRHSELNDSATRPVHFLQVWIEPATTDVPPRYEQRAFDAAGRAGRWQTLATGPGAAADSGAVRIDQDATVRVADLAVGAAVALHVEAGRHAYLHVATGAVRVGDTTLNAGDAFTTDTAGPVTLTATAPAQVLWFDLV